MLGPWITEDDKQAVRRALDAGDLMTGHIVDAFEAELAAYLGARHVVCVSSGTAALECAFIATREGSGLRSTNYIAIQSAARAAWGEEPCQSDFYGNGAAILGIPPTGYYMRILDAAHAFGTKGLPGDIHCYSFNQNKFICCIGGCLATDDSRIAAIAKQYRNHGKEPGTQKILLPSGRNLRLGDLNAALGRSQLRRIEEILVRRKQVAHWYEETLYGDGNAHTVPADRDSWFLYPVLCRARSRGFRTMADFRLFNSATDEDHRTALLPIWPLMTQEEVKAECDKIKAFL